MIRYLPLNVEHIPAAAELAAERYRAARALNPLLPERFTRAAALASRLQGLVEKVPGIAALRDNSLCGFLLGFQTMLFRGLRGVFVPDWGHAALAEHLFDTYRGMYAALAPQWLANQCFLHAIQFFAPEQAARDAWCSLGFGMVVIDALRDLEPVDDRTDFLKPVRSTGETPAIEIRQVNSDSVADIFPLEMGLERHLSAAPIFLPWQGYEPQALSNWLAEPSHALWAAYDDDRAVAYLRMEPSRRYVLPTADEITVSLTGAFTLPEFRGQSVGAALLNHALAWARAQGYQKCAVDFESANLTGRRFWLKHFQPVCYAFARRIDERIGVNE